MSNINMYMKKIKDNTLTGLSCCLTAGNTF